MRVCRRPEEFHWAEANGSVFPPMLNRARLVNAKKRRHEPPPMVGGFPGRGNSTRPMPDRVGRP